MAVPFSNTKLRVPKGFQNILECLAREVLRSQPDNIHEFGATYFENLLKVRNETGHDPAIHGAQLEDRNYNNEAFKKRSVDPSDPQQNSAALAIQTQFRQHSAKEEVTAMKEEMAATRIQAGFRGYLDREHVRDMKSESQKGDEEVDIDLNDPEVEKAAIKIQAGFKGFKARKDIQDKTGDSGQTEEDTMVAEPEPQIRTEDNKDAEVGKDVAAEEEIDIDLTDPDVEKAAVKIQAGFKGLKARKKLTDEKEQHQEAPESTQPISGEAESQQPGEEVDIDLEDPETEKAALKIQAGFRGYQTRKDLKDVKQEDGTQEDAEPEEETNATSQAEAESEETPMEAKAVAEEEDIDIDLNDPEVEKAATKIQAGFKGFKARKEVQDMKAENQQEEAKAAADTEDQTGETPKAEGGDEAPVDAAPEGESQAQISPETEKQAEAAETVAMDEVDAVPAPVEEDAAPPAETTDGEGAANAEDEAETAPPEEAPADEIDTGQSKVGEEAPAEDGTQAFSPVPSS